jgi:hypothetical protein
VDTSWEMDCCLLLLFVVCCRCLLLFVCLFQTRSCFPSPGSADRLGSRGSTTQRTNSTRHRQNHYTAIREITRLMPDPAGWEDSFKARSFGRTSAPTLRSTP